MIDKMLGSLLKQYGITPQHVQMTMDTIAAINRAVGEIEGFKIASSQVVKHFNARFDALETRMGDIEAGLQVIVQSSNKQDAS